MKIKVFVIWRNRLEDRTEDGNRTEHHYSVSVVQKVERRRRNEEQKRSNLNLTIIHSILVGTYIYLFIFQSISNNLTPHKLSEGCLEWCSFISMCLCFDPARSIGVDGWGVWCVFVCSRFCLSWCSSFWAGGWWFRFWAFDIRCLCYYILYYTYTIIIHILYYYILYYYYYILYYIILYSSSFSSSSSLPSFLLPLISFILYLSVLTYTYLYSRLISFIQISDPAQIIGGMSRVV